MLFSGLALIVMEFYYPPRDRFLYLLSALASDSLIMPDREVCMYEFMLLAVQWNYCLVRVRCCLLEKIGIYTRRPPISIHLLVVSAFCFLNISRLLALALARVVSSSLFFYTSLAFQD